MSQGWWEVSMGKKLWSFNKSWPRSNIIFNILHLLIVEITNFPAKNQNQRSRLKSFGQGRNLFDTSGIQMNGGAWDCAIGLANIKKHRSRIGNTSNCNLSSNFSSIQGQVEHNIVGIKIDKTFNIPRHHLSLNK